MAESNLKEIAKASGVSLETASRVLNGKYKGRTAHSQDVMKRVNEAAERMRYRPHNAARSMRTRSSGMIGLVVEETVLITHPVISETMRGINQALAEEGFILTITSLEGVSMKTFESRIFKERLIDGIIVVDNISPGYTEMMRARIPACVAVNNNDWKSQCCIRRDEFAAGQTAGSELAKLGYEKALYFELPPPRPPEFTHYSEPDRLSGFEAGFCAGSAKRKVELHRLSYDGRMEPDLREYLISQRKKIGAKTVMVAATCLILHSLKTAIPELLLKPGSDFGLACIDDESGLLKSSPGIARVSFPRHEIGKAAGRMVLDAIKGSKTRCASLLFKGSWTGGDSVRQVKNP